MSNPRNSPELPHLGSVSLDEGFSLDLDHYLTKDYEDISLASQELPALIEWVNQQLQYVIERRHIVKQELKTIRGRLYIRFKNGEASSALNGRISDSGIEALIDTDDEYIEASTNFARTLGWHSRLSNLLCVLQAKLDLVRSSESTRRKLITEEDD